MFTINFQKKVQSSTVLLCNLNVLIDVKYDVSVNKRTNKLVNDVHSATNLYKFLFCACSI